MSDKGIDRREGAGGGGQAGGVEQGVTRAVMHHCVATFHFERSVKFSFNSVTCSFRETRWR